MPTPAAGVLAQRHLLQCVKQNISNCRKWKEEKQMGFQNFRFQNWEFGCFLFTHRAFAFNNTQRENRRRVRFMKSTAIAVKWTKGSYQHQRSFYQRLIFEARKKSNCLAFHKWFLCTFWQQKVTEKIKRLLSLSQQSLLQRTLRNFKKLYLLRRVPFRRLCWET